MESAADLGLDRKGLVFSEAKVILQITSTT
jgi:hypothetical protein